MNFFAASPRKDKRGRARLPTNCLVEVGTPRRGVRGEASLNGAAHKNFHAQPGASARRPCLQRRNLFVGTSHRFVGWGLLPSHLPRLVGSIPAGMEARSRWLSEAHPEKRPKSSGILEGCQHELRSRHAAVIPAGMSYNYRCVWWYRFAQPPAASCDASGIFRGGLFLIS